MKKFGKQSKEITLKRTGGDFLVKMEVGYYYKNNEEIGPFIDINKNIIFFASFKEYWRTYLPKLLIDLEGELTKTEASVLSHVVEELRIETETGVNQLYLDDETWITGVFDII